MTTAVPPDRIREHLTDRGPIAADVHAVADTAWELRGAGMLDLPLPGAGDTISRWWALVEIAAVDLAVARLVEGHLEAQALHAEAGRPLPDGLWAVWATETADTRLEATPSADGWHLRGDKRWCAGARSVTTALVTAWDDETVRLFALPIRDPAVRFDPDSFPAAGLALADALHMTVDGLELPAAAEVGTGNWYRNRPGHWVTLAAAAASWYGGALGMARALRAAADAAPSEEHLLVALGAVDAACATMEATLGYAAKVADRGDVELLRTTAWQCRATVRNLAGAVLSACGDALGIDALSHDGPLSRRLADLQVALRAHGGAREHAQLGGDVLDAGRLT